MARFFSTRFWISKSAVVSTSTSLTEIAGEGLKKAGYKSDNSNSWPILLQRAEDNWMEEIKNDILIYTKKLGELQVASTIMTTNGVNKYNLPTDYLSDLTILATDGTRYDPVNPKTIWTVESHRNPSMQGIPEEYAIITESGEQKIILYPTPYLEGSNWKLNIRYYADLNLISLSSVTMEHLYRKWRSLWVQGVFAKALQNKDDARYPAEVTNYKNMIKMLSAKQTYGNDLSNLQITVE
jgi:hypothetical protein